MKYFSLIVLFISISFFGQKNKNGYEINIKTHNLVGKKLYLSLYNGSYKNSFKIDSAEVKKENEIVKFTQKQKVRPAIYQLSIKNNSAKIDLAIDNGLSMTVDVVNDFLTSVVTSNKLNQDFFNYQNSTNKEEQKKLISSFSTKYKNSVLGIFALLEDRKNNREVYEKQNISKFLQGITTIDYNLQLLPNTYSFLNTYFGLKQLTNKNYQEAANQLLKNSTCTTSKNHFFYLKWIFNNLVLHENQGLYETYKNIFEKYLNTESCIKENGRFYTEYSGKLRVYDQFPLGSVAKDFKVQDLAGKESTFSSFITKNTFVVFYDPLCDHCKTFFTEEVKKIENVEKLTGKKLNKIAFFNITDASLWKKFVDDHKMDGWINLRSLNGSLEYQKDLNLYANPTFYGFDKNLKLISKRFSEGEIQKILNE